MLLEKTLESPLDSKTKPVNPKGNQSWIFFGRTDIEAEAPILWPPDENSRLTGEDPDAGKDGRQKEKTATEDEMVGWYHLFNRHKLGQTPGDAEGWGSLPCCSPLGHKESERFGNWTTTTAMSPSNGSLFHSEEKLKSLQWLIQPTMISPLLLLPSPHLKPPPPLAAFPCTSAALFLFKPARFSPTLGCISCSLCINTLPLHGLQGLLPHLP